MTDLLTSAEKEDLISKKMEQMRLKNEALEKRHAEIEAEKKMLGESASSPIAKPAGKQEWRAPKYKDDWLGREKEDHFRAGGGSDWPTEEERGSRDSFDRPHRGRGGNSHRGGHRGGHGFHQTGSSHDEVRVSGDDRGGHRGPTEDRRGGHRGQNEDRRGGHRGSRGSPRGAPGSGRLGHGGSGRPPRQEREETSYDETRRRNAQEYEEQLKADQADQPFGFLTEKKRDVYTDVTRTNKEFRGQDQAKRHPRNFGGDNPTDLRQKVKNLREKSQNNHGPVNAEMSMTGKQRQEYTKWKDERRKIDDQRLERARAQQGGWKREWDNSKTNKEPLPPQMSMYREQEERQVTKRVGSGRFVSQGDRRSTEESTLGTGTIVPKPGAPMPKQGTTVPKLHTKVSKPDTSVPKPASAPAPVMKGLPDVKGSVPAGRGRGRGIKKPNQPGSRRVHEKDEKLQITINTSNSAGASQNKPNGPASPKKHSPGSKQPRGGNPHNNRGSKMQYRDIRLDKQSQDSTTPITLVSTAATGNEGSSGNASVEKSTGPEEEITSEPDKETTSSGDYESEAEVIVCADPEDDEKNWQDVDEDFYELTEEEEAAAEVNQQKQGNVGEKTPDLSLVLPEDKVEGSVQNKALSRLTEQEDSSITRATSAPPSDHDLTVQIKPVETPASPDDFLKTPEGHQHIADWSKYMDEELQDLSPMTTSVKAKSEPPPPVKDL